MSKRKLPPPAKPLSTEVECVFDVTTRFVMFGKPDKIKAELQRNVAREMELQFSNAEVRRIVRVKQP